ncbi:MAG: GNAT family N-acetyltransferase [Rhodobiaceae bacterium]|nr:GNAT family N-acetyltransferase [Rhodobiaceae bacterium]MCC0015923.1 GNAT family N-acetyltransferase [Rhodobiaceae bacterium]MCC0040708.1 GNAT family N-acetyltransferase [Rhodobiaceae bacterium]
MVFLRSVGGDFGPVIYGERIRLRTPQLSDYAQWAELRARSRAFLTPWEPTWPADDLSRTAFRRRVRRYVQEVREDLAYPLFAFAEDTGELLGGVTLGNVRRGVTQSCAMGYWVGEPHARCGHMTRAVEAVLDFAFARLRLHRVEAACLPANRASIRLLEKSGFTQEGYARRYLCINGIWQDHLLYAMLHDDPRPPAR